MLTTVSQRGMSITSIRSPSPSSGTSTRRAGPLGRAQLHLAGLDLITQVGGVLKIGKPSPADQATQTSSSLRMAMSTAALADGPCLMISATRA